jgi:hypothetical protein
MLLSTVLSLRGRGGTRKQHILLPQGGTAGGGARTMWAGPVRSLFSDWMISLPPLRGRWTHIRVLHCLIFHLTNSEPSQGSRGNSSRDCGLFYKYKKRKKNFFKLLQSLHFSQLTRAHTHTHTHKHSPKFTSQVNRPREKYELSLKKEMH